MTMAFFARALVVVTAALFVNADIRSDLTGKGFSVLFPGDSGYSTASQAFNQRFSYQPAAIAYPVNSQQVSTVIKAGSANNLRVVARSGGHSYIANGLGGQNNVVVVDMQNFNTLTVDSSTNTAVIGTGMRLGNVALALNAQGRALPHGTCPYVGVGGHSGYGGFGFTSRMWGLTLDNIISLNVVLADGTITTASATTNPDLFWALRGSSGSFGITTAIQVKTYAAPSSVTVFTYDWDLTASAAASALSAYQTFAQSNIPAPLGLEVVLGKGSSSGRVSFEITGGWYGPTNQFSGAISPLLNSLPSPSRTSVTPGSYIDSVKAFSFADSLDTTTGPEQRDTFYAKSLMTPQASPISAVALSSFMSYLGSTGFSSNTNWFIQFELWGAPNSAINAVSSDATSFPHRSSMFAVQFYASSSNYNPPFPASGLTFVDGAVNAILNNSPSGWDYGAYVNYVDDRLQDWQQRYYGSAYSRLNTIKTTYDSKGVFSFPTSINFSGSSSGGGGGGGGTTPTSVAIHPNGNTNKCLDVRGAVYANGNPVQIYDCNGTPAQSWTITRGSTQIKVAGQNFCLDAGSNPANGVGMKIWTCFDGLAAQSWSYTSSNTIALSSANQCLDLTDGSVTNGNQVQTWQCSAGNTNQVWTT